MYLEHPTKNGQNIQPSSNGLFRSKIKFSLLFELIVLTNEFCVSLFSIYRTHLLSFLIWYLIFLLLLALLVMPNLRLELHNKVCLLQAIITSFFIFIKVSKDFTCSLFGIRLLVDFAPMMAGFKCLAQLL